jgi:hypothetical protein
VKKSFWIPAAVVVALIGAVTVFALTNPQKVEDLKQEIPIAMAPKTIELPAGTPVALTLQTTLSTKTANVGDRFTAVVSAPVSREGEVLIPAGAEVEGRVILAEQPGKASGRGRLQLAYESVSFDGRSYELGSRSQIYESKSGTGKDAAMIGGGAVAGGVVGGILGGSAGDAAKGAVVGGAAGTAASLMTRGPQLELERGTTLRFTLDRTIMVRPPSA